MLYAQQVLGVELWADQEEVARALVQHRRVMVRASHSVGKTHMGGTLVNWFYDCFRPGITLTTAPTQAQVQDLLWKEVRVQRRGRPGLQPKAPRMESAPDHFAAGFTARDSNAFQGRHESNVFIIFDEAVGVDGQFWDGATGMLTGDNCYWLTIFNPTDTSSRAYEEEQSGRWWVKRISALDHPNIAAELAGLPAPIPAAVRLSWVLERLERWCTPISSTDRKATDVEFPPQSNQWFRPGSLFESRVLGRWPTQGATSVWTEAAWDQCLVVQLLPHQPTEIGCDVARFGDDYTSIVVRRGACALHHETHNGWSTQQTAGRLKQLCKEFAQEGEDPCGIACKIDDDGVGGGVVDAAGGYSFRPVGGGTKAWQPEDYPNRRSEMWFSVADRADRGELDLSRLSEESRNLLRRQVMAPKWRLDSQGRRVVEPKVDTKKRIGRSPDDADALNLAFAPAPTLAAWDLY